MISIILVYIGILYLIESYFSKKILLYNYFVLILELHKLIKI